MVTKLAQVAEMVKTMNVRLTGHEMIGLNKRYGQDPAGAISLQKKIGRTIEAIKTELVAMQKPDEGEIVPLESRFEVFLDLF